MLFTDKQIQEKIKLTNEANVDLQLKIDSLNLEIRQLKWNLDRYEASEEDMLESIQNLSDKNNNLRDVIKTYEDNAEELKYRKDQTELWKENTKKATSQREVTYAKLLISEEVKEKFETENIILKSANKVLSEVNAKVQPIMDENIRLNSQLVNMAEITSIKDETIKDLKSQLVNKDEKVAALMQIITTFQTKDAQVVQAQVIQPSVIEPTILSSKK